MKRHLILALVLLTSSAAVAAAEHLKLDYSRPVEGIQAVELEAGVGDVELIGDDSTTVTARVDVSPKVGHFWSREDDTLAGVEVRAVVQDGTLRLRVGRDHDNGHSWGEEWTVHLPRSLAVKVQLGVGETKVLDVAGDVTVEVGVGDVRVEGAQASFGRVHASSGVGDATLRTPQGRESGDGFIGHSISSHGPGQSEIRISAGVGDTEIRLR